MENKDERARAGDNLPGTTPGSRTTRRPKPSAQGGPRDRDRESHTYDPPSQPKYNYHYRNQQVAQQVLANQESMTRASQELRNNPPRRAYGKEEDFLADLRLPGV